MVAAASKWSQQSTTCLYTLDQTTYIYHYIHRLCLSHPVVNLLLNLQYCNRKCFSMQRSGVNLGSFKPTEPLHCCKKTKSQSGAGEDYIISNRMIMMKQKNALSELLQYYAILLRYLEIKEEHHGISFQKKWGLGRSRVAWPGRWKLHVEPGPLVLAETPRE